MSNPEMKGARILRFHTSDKVFHSINAICWYALVITGAIVYFGHWMGDISDETANLMMVWHLWLGALFTLNFVGYVLFAPERFAVTLKNLLEWDKNTIMWFRNFGGYPRRFFKIPFGPVEVPPQGRYNGGQKMSYLIFLAAVVYLIASGWLLWLGAPLVLLLRLLLALHHSRLGKLHCDRYGYMRSYSSGSPVHGTLQGHLENRIRRHLL